VAVAEAAREVAESMTDEAEAAAVSAWLVAALNADAASLVILPKMLFWLDIKDE